MPVANVAVGLIGPEPHHQGQHRPVQGLGQLRRHHVLDDPRPVPRAAAAAQVQTHLGRPVHGAHQAPLVTSHRHLGQPLAALAEGHPAAVHQHHLAAPAQQERREHVVAHPAGLHLVVQEELPIREVVAFGLHQVVAKRRCIGGRGVERHRQGVAIDCRLSQHRLLLLRAMGLPHPQRDERRQQRGDREARHQPRAKPVAAHRQPRALRAAIAFRLLEARCTTGPLLRGFAPCSYTPSSSSCCS